MTDAMLAHAFEVARDNYTGIRRWRGEPPHAWEARLEVLAGIYRAAMAALKWGVILAAARVIESESRIYFIDKYEELQSRLKAADLRVSTVDVFGAYEPREAR